MKKAIKKTCVVLLLFALLASQVAASYSETGTLNEGTSAISAAERYLSNWAYNSYMYADKNLTLGTVLDAEVDPASLRRRDPGSVDSVPCSYPRTGNQPKVVFHHIAQIFHRDLILF